MKLNEILDKALPFKVIDTDESEFMAEFKVEDRFIIFSAVNEGMMDDDDEGEWDIVFGEKVPDQRHKDDDTYATVTFAKTNKGNEFQIFATLKAILQRFIKDTNPQKIKFSADKEAGKATRADLYARLFKKNLPAGWKINRDESPVNHEPVFFTLVKEGMMKRSDPYISGETDTPTKPRTPTAHQTRIETLMKKSGKSMEKVEAAWNRAARDTPDGPKKWANVMIRAKADLGISI